MINREIEEERSKFMECYKERLSMEEVEELIDRMSVMALTTEMAGFELWVRSAEKLLYFCSIE